MPTVRGLIQDIQHNGLLRSNKLSMLNNCTIGVDATFYFEPLYTPPSATELLGTIDYTGLEAVIKKHLAQFKASKITPIFVFPGVSTHDRVYTTAEAERINQEQLALLEQQAQQQSQQTPSFPQDQQGNDGFGFYRPLAKNKRNKKNQFALQEPMQPSNGFVAQQNNTTTNNTSATSTVSSTLDEVQWSFDEQSLLNRQRGWDQLGNKNYDTAQQLFFDMQTTFGFQHRKALLQTLQKYQKSGEFGQFAILLAPYGVSPQLAWLQRQPHSYVHAVIGQSDALLFGVERYLQTINFDTQTFNYILLTEVLQKYAMSLTQLISVSLLTGYSFALTHPLALADFKTPSTYNFVNALNNLRTRGGGSLQTLLEWWIQQPPGPSHTVAVNGNLSQAHNNNNNNNGSNTNNKDDLLHLQNIVSLDEQLATATNINKVLQQLQGALVFGHGAQLVLLRDSPCELVDMVKLTLYGKCAQRQFKEQIKQHQQIALQSNIPLLKGKQLAAILQPVAVTPQQLLQQYNTDRIPVPQKLTDIVAQLKATEQPKTTSPSLETSTFTPIQLPNLQNQQITTRPHIPLPSPILQLLSTSSIQASSLSSLLTGHILDVTVQNPSNELDQILDWTNLSLRGPAIWSLLYSFNQVASSPTTTVTVDDAYKALYSRVAATKVNNNDDHQHSQQQLPFILNSRFNDKRKSIWPRDIIAYCRRGGSDGDISYGIDKINHYENNDKILSKEQLSHFQNLLKNMTKTANSTPISHYLLLLPELMKVQPHPNPASTTAGGKKKKANVTTSEPLTIINPTENSITLTNEEQFVGLGMLYILYFIGLITAQGTMTRLGYSIMTLIQQLQQQDEILSPQLFDTLLFIYILTAASDVMTTKSCTIESSELNNPNFVLGSKNDTQNQRLNKVVYRLLALLPFDLQQSLLQNTNIAPNGTDNNTTTTTSLYQSLLSTQPQTEEDIAIAQRLAKANPSNNQGKNNVGKNAAQQRQQLQDRFVPLNLISILNREVACYSSIITSLLHSFNYAFDLILASLSLYQLYPQIDLSIVPTLIPLQDYQSSPILSCLLRQRSIAHPPQSKNNKNNNTVVGYSLLAPNTPTLTSQQQRALVGMWDAIVQGTGGVGITTEEIQTALASIMM